MAFWYATMDKRIKERLVGNLTNLYSKDGIEEVNKRIGVILKGDLGSFKEIEEDFGLAIKRKYYGATNETTT